MNERLRRHARLIAGSLAVLLIAGLAYVLRPAHPARAQSGHTAASPVATPHAAPSAVAVALAPAPAVRRRTAGDLAGSRSGSRHLRVVARSASHAGVPTPPPSSRALALALRQATGLEPSQVTSRPVCGRAGAGHASCAAQVLVLRSSGAPVRPRVARYRSLGRVRPAVGRAVRPASEPAAAGAPQPDTPAYLQQAYDLSSLSQSAGNGDTVAIVDAYDDPTAQSDLAAYRSNYGLPTCGGGCFQKVNQQGQASPLPVTDAGWAQEISLDLDAVSAICPNCHILLVEANSNSFSDLQTAMQTAASLHANQISASWSGTSSSVPTGTFTFPGVATVAATGDYGYVRPGQDNYPAALPGVTAAGGTSLAPASTGARGFSEGAWAWNGVSGGGSGCDLQFARPVYQPASGCAGRAYADLSAVADPSTGLTVYYNGQRILVGGTSLSTPLVAAYYAISGVAATTPRWAYAEGGLFNDVVSGSAGSCSTAILYICDAGPGYDGPTGMGSISGSVVTGAPGIGGPAVSSGSSTPNTYTQSVASRGATIAGGIYRNSLDTSWWIEYGTSTAYGSQTRATDIGAGGAPVSVTGYLSGLTAGTVYHYRLVAQNSLGTTYGYDYTFTTSAASPSAPTAAFTAPSSPAVPGSLTFNGDGSAAGTGATITDYRWSYGDGATFDGGTASTATHTYARGTYTVTLTVTNSAGQSDSTTQTVTVDNPPTAAFTPSTTTAAPGTAVAFDASASAPGAGGHITDYSWTFNDGASADTGTTASGTHTFTAPGAYTVTLTTTDDLNVTKSASAQITVAPFTAAPAIPAPGAAVTFTALISSLQGSPITNYHWDFGDGKTADTGTTGNAAHTYSARGSETVTLTITNSANQTSTSTETLTVDTPPTAAFTPSASAVAPGAAMGFDAGASSAAAGGSITRYTWDFGDGSAPQSSTSNAPVGHVYNTTGTYTVTLTATDELGVSSAPASQQVIVDQPTAAFTTSSDRVAPNAPASFDASASTDAVGSITDYKWNFGDGTQTVDTGTTATATHTYAARHAYQVQLTVTNQYGQTSTSSQPITVDTPPTVAFTPSATTVTPGTAISFDASASSATAGGSITHYRWSFGDGSAPVDTGASAGATHTFATAGTWTVTLTATDDLGLTATAAAQVVVAAAPTPPASPAPFSPPPPVSSPSPVSSPTPAPPAPSPLSAGLSGASKQRLATVLAHGLRLGLAINQSATASIQVTIPPAQTKHGVRLTHGMRNPRAVVLLRVTQTLAAGHDAITLKLSRAVASQLAATGPIVLTIRVTLKNAADATVTRTIKVTLPRR